MCIQINSIKQNALICLIFISPLLLFVLINPQDWFGFLLIYFCLLYIFSQKVFINKKSVLFIVLTLFFFKLLVSITNAFFVNLYGANSDSLRFHNNAANIVLLNEKINILQTGTAGYESFLALFYRVFGISQFLGQNLSILAFLISLSTLLKLSQIIQGDKYQKFIIIFFGFLPSNLIYTSIIMREPYQIMFFLLSLYSLAKMIKTDKIRPIHYLKFLVFAFLLGMLHNGLLVFSIILVTIGTVIILPKKLGILRWLISVGIISSILLIVMGETTVLGISTPATEAVFSGNINDYIERYRDGGMRQEARATYNTEFDSSSIGAMIVSGSIVFFYYMFAPFPWQLTSVIDLYAALFNALMVTLFVTACFFYKKERKNNVNRRIIITLLLFSFILESLWSLGTVNWGTAIRHHLLAYSVLLVLGSSVILEKLRKLIIK
ncbi:hypothetical protein [Pueribacillus sp. YX66]|uniref:hypothetical protein n=1 Tax=Pueribacillus sp. YX66 TaxID=3229242 RepID=UPI00358CE8C0